MKVLGIDPGTGRLGWAIVEKEKGKETLIDCGCIETPANTGLEIRLEAIFTSLQSVISKYQPESAAIENLFFAKNQKTVISVGAARGVAILACQLPKLNISHYTPLQVKSAITGYGSADKEQVAFMVKQLLHLKELDMLDDTIDAIAIALTHIANLRTSAILVS